MTPDDFVSHGALDDRFPAPTDRPFAYADALAAGLSRHTLRILEQRGLLRRPIQGVYVDASVPDSLDLRAAALRLVVPEDCVVVDRHAGWLLGAQMVLAPGEHLELRPLSLFRPSGNGRLRNGISRSGERWLRESDISNVGGLRVTTALRTALDLGRVRRTEEAISGLDAMFRLGGFTREEFLDGIEQFRGHRWVRTLRAIGPLADGRSESPGESVLRLRTIECGLTMTPQVEVHRHGRLLARLDLADERRRFAAEYDGAEWHSSPDQQAHDRRRRAAVAREEWIVQAFTAEHVFDRRAVCDVMLRRAALEAEHRFGVRRAG